jgi:hypothetical protein
MSQGGDAAVSVLAGRCFERATDEAVPFDESLKALSKFFIGTRVRLQPSQPSRPNSAKLVVSSSCLTVASQGVGRSDY